MKKIKFKKEISIGLACLAGIGIFCYNGIILNKKDEIIEIQGRSIIEHSEQLEQKEKETEEMVATISAKDEEITSLQTELDSARREEEGITGEITALEEQIKVKEERERQKKAEASKNASHSSGRRIKVEVSGYCSCHLCSEGWGNKTADGTGVRWGVIAAPRELPFGTKMKIDGFGDTVFTVHDRGGYIIKVGDTYRIDVWFPSHVQANAYGRRTVYATIQ